MPRMRDAETLQSVPLPSKTRELWLYFVLAFGISFVLWIPVLFGSKHSFLYLPIGTFGPTLAALTTHRLMRRNWRAFRLWTDLRRFGLGIVLGGSAVLMSAFCAAFLMTQTGFDQWQWSALLRIPMLLMPNLLGGPLGEEPGWRGYALPRLQRRFNPVTSSVLLGFLSANWHLPLILAGVYNVTWWQFVITTMAVSVPLSFAFNKSGGSTLCAVVVHGLYNVATGIILNDFLARATLYSNPVQHNVFWIAYAGIATLLCFITRGRLGYPTNSTDTL